jgi:hypothetical protein
MFERIGQPEDLIWACLVHAGRRQEVVEVRLLGR